MLRAKVPPSSMSREDAGYHQIASSFSINHVDFVNLLLEPTVFVRFCLLLHTSNSMLLLSRDIRGTQCDPGLASAFARCYMQANASDKVNVTKQASVAPITSTAANLLQRKEESRPKIGLDLRIPHTTWIWIQVFL